MPQLLETLLERSPSSPQLKSESSNEDPEKPRGAGLAGESGGVTGRRKLRGGREPDHLEVRRDVRLELEGETSREGARNLARGS